MNDDARTQEGEPERSRYRVVSHHGAGLVVSVHLRADGWAGADLYLCGTQAVVEQDYAVGSVQVITPAQRQRWRDAGTLIGSSDER